jgi:hypothetical protein
MSPEDVVRTACPLLNNLGWRYYFAPQTLERGKELNLDGFRFYFLGRGGVLGDVEWPVVQAAFGYFNPSLIEHMWDSAREVLSPRDAARAHLECCALFGREHLSGVAGLDSFCDAAEAVVAAANPAALSLFAGFAAEPLPTDPPARAMQLAATLRELRGSAHLVAVVASGMTPLMAHTIKRPDDLGTFGWGASEAPEVTAADRERAVAIEALTDRLVTPAFAVLDERRAAALIDGVNHIDAVLGHPVAG